MAEQASSDLSSFSNKDTNSIMGSYPHDYLPKSVPLNTITLRSVIQQVTAAQEAEQLSETLALNKIFLKRAGDGLSS